MRIVFAQDFVKTTLEESCMLRRDSSEAWKGMTHENRQLFGYLSTPFSIKIFPHAVCRHARAAQKVR